MVSSSIFDDTYRLPPNFEISVLTAFIPMPLPEIELISSLEEKPDSKISEIISSSDSLSKSSLLNFSSVKAFDLIFCGSMPQLRW